MSNENKTEELVSTLVKYLTEDQLREMIATLERIKERGGEYDYHIRSIGHGILGGRIYPMNADDTLDLGNEVDPQELLEYSRDEEVLTKAEAQMIAMHLEAAADRLHGAAERYRKYQGASGKLFLCWWDPDRYEGDETKVVPLNFFIDEHGYFDYNNDYRADLDKLKIGESYIPDEGPTSEVSHIIVRIR